MMLKRFVVLVCFAAAAALAQSTTINPDCTIDFTFTAAGQVTANNTCGHNTVGIVDWQVVYFSTGFSALSLEVQSAPDNGGAPGTWVAFPGMVAQGVNPNTATDQAASRLLGYFPWNRVRLNSVTGSGSIRGRLYGCRAPGCSIGGPPASAGALPAGCPGPGSVQLYLTAIAFGCDPTFHDYTGGIPDPAAPPVVVANVVGATSYSYVIVETNGVGWTLPSPTATIMNGQAATPDNSITLPVASGAFCYVVRTAGPGSPFNRTGSFPHACDGSIVLDNFNVTPSTQFPFTLPVSNTTTGVLLTGGPGNFVSAGPNFGIVTGGQSMQLNPQVNGLVGSDAFGNPLSYIFSPTPDGTWGLANISGISNPWFTSGDAWNVTTVDNTNSPYTIRHINDGILKCDATTGNRSMTLPDTSFAADPFFPSGRIFVIHKVDTSANTCTIVAGGATMIDGSATYVLTQPFESVTVYWDGANWPTSSRPSGAKLVGVSLPLAGSSVINFGSIPDGSCASNTFALTGALATDKLAQNAPALEGGLGMTMLVTAADTIEVRLCNLSGGAVDPASQTFYAAVVR